METSRRTDKNQEAKKTQTETKTQTEKKQETEKGPVEIDPPNRNKTLSQKIIIAQEGLGALESSKELQGTEGSQESPWQPREEEK